jgi:bis(5'-nucleosyl)-tetraphosphatase (symmetrical)
MVRRICVGDIQGCLDSLERLLQTVGLRREDRLYSVGDLVNRGPDSIGVLRRLRGLKARVVLGNHDLHLLRLALGSRPPAAGPLRDLFEASDRNELIAWLAAKPVLLVEDDLVVVHAGIHPRWRDLPRVARSLHEAVADHIRGHPDPGVTFATRVRYCDANGRRPVKDDPPPGEPYRPWDDFYDGRRTVVFGHWARRGLVVGPRVRGLDTGCVWGGPLTAWIADEDRFVQVPGLSGASLVHTPEAADKTSNGNLGGGPPFA